MIVAKSKKELMREEDKDFMAIQWYGWQKYLNDPKEDKVWNKHLKPKKKRS